MLSKSFRNARLGISSQRNALLSSQIRNMSIQSKGWLVTWGSNNFGGLGHPRSERFQTYPMRIGIPKVTPENIEDIAITPLDESSNEEDFADITEVACGWSINLAATKDGRVYQWGFGKRVQDLISAIKLDHSLPSVFKWLRKINLISTSKPVFPNPARVPLFGVKTYAEYKAVCANMKAIAVDEEYFNPEEFHAKILACGPDCTAVITETGSLYTWANTGDFYGKTGHGGDKSMLPYKSPRRVGLPGPAVSVSFGFNHMAVLLKDGSLYSCGLGTSGALGLPTYFVDNGKDAKQVSPPQCVNDNVRTFFLDLKDALETSRYGVHKDFKKEFAPPNPEKLAVVQKNSETATSTAQSASPLAEITEKEKELAENDIQQRVRTQFLANVNEALENKGSDTKEGTNNPLKTLETHGSYELPAFKAVSCGFSHTCAVDVHGNVWSMGRNNHGELGLVLDPTSDEGKRNVDAHAGVNTGLTPVDFRLHYIPTVLQSLIDMGVKVAKLSCGHHHTIALSEDGDVYTWGSNEYGQCARLHEQPSTLRAKSTKRQPWALPPGKVRISSSVLQGCHIVDVKAGFYDSVVVLSDGRALVFGSYLSDQSSPRPMYLLEHFEPKTPLKGHKAKYLVQTLGSKELAPPQYYEHVQEQEEPALSVMYGGRYELKKIDFGLHYAVAVAVPRKAE